jgi:hypothetical protein
VSVVQDQLGGQAGEALGLAFGSARLGHEMLSIHVAELAQSAHDRLGGWAPGLGPDQVGGHPKTQDPDPIDISRGLGGDRAGHREDRESEAAEEGAPVRHSITSSA